MPHEKKNLKQLCIQSGISSLLLINLFHVVFFSTEDIFQVSLVSISTTSAIISLKLAERLNNNITYTISYTNINNTDCFIDSNHITDITTTGDETMYTLTGLQENTQYSINVTVILSNRLQYRKNISIATISAGECIKFC